MAIYNLGIDVKTHDKKKLIARLARLTSTLSVDDGGEYWQDHSYSQVHITTTKTEEELEDWLYKYSRCDYVGVFERD